MTPEVKTTIDELRYLCDSHPEMLVAASYWRKRVRVLLDELEHREFYDWLDGVILEQQVGDDYGHIMWDTWRDAIVAHARHEANNFTPL